MGAHKGQSAPLDLSLAGESRRAYGSELLPQRLAIYAKAHERTVAMSEYIRDQKNSNKQMRQSLRAGLVNSLSTCGNYLLFRDYYTVHEIRLHKANFCKKHLICPFCASRRALKYTSAYMKKLEQVLKENPGLWPYLVTLTVKDGPDLLERFKHLKHGIDHMTVIRKEAARGRRPSIEMNKAIGGVSSYEIKRGKNSGEWHPHYHATWLCEEQPYETKLSEEWKDILGDSFIVDVKPFTEGQGVITGFLEVFAYALKFSTLTLEDNLEAFLKLNGKRFITQFGVLRGVEIPEDLEDEPLENLPYVELLFKYMKGTGYNYMPGWSSKKT